jgi:hypothetical protein
VIAGVLERRASLVGRGSRKAQDFHEELSIEVDFVKLGLEARRAVVRWGHGSARFMAQLN